MFEKEYEFRFSDLDGKGDIKVSTVFDLLQDISVLHANSAGMTAGLKERGLACFLNGWRVRFNGKLNDSLPVKVRTGIVSVGKLESSRIYEIWQSGECVVTATSLWVIIDIERGKIVRTPVELFDLFESTEEEDNMLPVTKANAAKELACQGEYTVRKNDIDTNGHMNNVSSIQLMTEYIPDDCSISEITVKYRKQVKYGEAVKVFSGKADDKECLLIKNCDDDNCVIMNIL